MTAGKTTLAARARAREIKRKVLSWREYFPACEARDGETRPTDHDARLRDHILFQVGMEKGSTRSE